MKQYDTIAFGQINILNKAESAVERYKALAETLQYNSMDFLTIQEIVLPDEFFSIMAEAGYEYEVHGPMLANNKGTANCVAIISKTPVQKIDFNNPWEISLVGGTTIVQNQSYNIFSGHLSWGPHNGFTRLQQVSLVDAASADQEKNIPGSVSLFGGDLNTDPESRPIRFLKGHDLGADNVSSTLWMDAHEIAGNSDNWTTSDHSVNPYGMESAISAGVIDTDFLPQRRIDYIFSRGWLYGKNGFPVDFGYLTHPHGVILSDHNGIYSRIAIID